MGQVIDLEAYRLYRKAVTGYRPYYLKGDKAVSIQQGLSRADITADLLTGPLTPQVVDALEHLSDDELERFFIARARAQLAGSSADPT